MSDDRLSPVEVTSGKPGRYRGGSPGGGRRQAQATRLITEDLARQLREAIAAGRLRYGLVILDVALAEAIYTVLAAQLAAISKAVGPPARPPAPPRR